MRAGQLGCAAELNVEIFVIKGDTQLVDTKEKELLCTERMSLGLHVENKRGKGFHNSVICLITFNLSYFWKLRTLPLLTHNIDIRLHYVFPLKCQK